MATGKKSGIIQLTSLTLDTIRGVLAIALANTHSTLEIHNLALAWVARIQDPEGRALAGALIRRTGAGVNEFIVPLHEHGYVILRIATDVDKLPWERKDPYNGKCPGKQNETALDHFRELAPAVVVYPAWTNFFVSRPEFKLNREPGFIGWAARPFPKTLPTLRRFLQTEDNIIRPVPTVLYELLEAKVEPDRITQITEPDPFL